MQNSLLLKSLTGLVLVAALCSCSRLEAPPLEVQYRESIVGLGKIVRITNRNVEALSRLEVRIENPNGDVKNYELASIAAGETVELGWKKLDGFQVEAGAEVAIRSEGYALPYQAELDVTESTQ